MPKTSDSQKINDLIFKELIKRGYSLEGNTRIWNIADSKLWYLTPEQAQAFLDLEASKDYQRDLIKKEIDLINDHLDEIVDRIGSDPVNIIDLGCGDGKKAELFIKKLKGQRTRYCPIDISSYMVDKALKRLKGLPNVEEVVEFQWNISDFENVENISVLLREGEYKKHVFLLLGNTLGNFEINELLYSVRRAMRGGDILIIGNGLDNRNPQDILRAYNNPHLDNLLIKTLTQISLDKKDLEYGARFKNSRVEMYYTIKKTKELIFLGRKVTLYEGDQIIVGVSYKYNQGDFSSFMNLYFNEAMIKTSTDGAYALAICKK